MPNLYKCTLRDGGSVHGFPDSRCSNRWSLPTLEKVGWKKGDWKTMHPNSQLKPHFGGLHLAPADVLITWLREEIYGAEIDELQPNRISLDCVVATRARLVKRLDLPANKSDQLALRWATWALRLFEGLIFPWDMVRRLRDALDEAESDVARGVFPEPEARVWKHAQEVMQSCRQDQLSGFETNLNVGAAYHAAQAIIELSKRRKDGHWETVKNICHHCGFAASGLVEDLVLRHGRAFSVDRVPRVVGMWLQHDDERFTLLHHSVRWQVMRACNDELLAIIEEYNPGP